MKTGVYIIKNGIDSSPMNIYGKQNIIYHKVVQPSRDVNNTLNYILPEEEKGPYSVKQNKEYYNLQRIINPNGQIYSYKNKDNILNQNFLYTNINNNVANLKQYGNKMIIRNNIYPTNMIPVNQNNNITYSNANNTPGVVYNNINYTNPYSNPPLINKIPVMNIHTKPKIIPIRKNIIHKVYISPKKYFIKKDINIPSQRFTNIANTDNIDNNMLSEYNSKDNINNPFLITNDNDKINSNISNIDNRNINRIKIPKIDNDLINNNSNNNDMNFLTERRTFIPKTKDLDFLNENINININSTPIKVRNVTDILDYQYAPSESLLNNIISTPTKKTISPEQLINTKSNNDKYSKEKNVDINTQSFGLTQTFHNYIDNSQDYQENNDIFTTPIKTSSPNNNNNNSQNPSPSPDKLINNGFNNLQNINKLQQSNKKRDISIKSFHYLCRPGTEEDGSTKINQDTFLALNNVNNIKNFSIFAVLDGHGPFGNLVSKHASHSISTKIMNHPLIKSEQNIDNIYQNLKQNNFAIIKQAFIDTDNQLKNGDLEVDDSGTTCILVIIVGNHLISANVGDSRAIVVFDENNSPNLSYLKIVPISVDFKPELPEEKNRIINAGGVVEQLKNYRGVGTGPMRVFSPGKNTPGLAMSRSIGDTIAKTLGVIAEPDIIEYELCEKSKFVVMCSDGVWEFLSNEKVKNLGRRFYMISDSSGLCEELYSNALIEWKCNDSMVDDITVICIFFN